MISKSRLILGGFRDSRVSLDTTKLTHIFADVDSSRWQILYLAKLRACHTIADFSEAKKDADLKEDKKDCLIEVIDLLDE